MCQREKKPRSQFQNNSNPKTSNIQNRKRKEEQRKRMSLEYMREANLSYMSRIGTRKKEMDEYTEKVWDCINSRLKTLRLLKKKWSTGFRTQSRSKKWKVNDLRTCQWCLGRNPPEFKWTEEGFNHSLQSDLNWQNFKRDLKVKIGLVFLNPEIIITVM